MQALSEADNPGNPYVIPALALRGYLDAFLARGWDLDFMIEPGNLERAMVFGGENVAGTAGEIYRDILYYYRDYGIVPPPAHIRGSYPTSKVPWDTDLTPEEVIGETNRKIRTATTSMFMGDLHGFLSDPGNGSRLIEVDDVDALVTLTEGFIRKIQETGPVSLPFRLLSLDDIDSLPDPEILIDGLIDHGTVTKLVGESGKGKSFVAIDWSLCIATGRRWQGRRVRQGKVLYIAAEGAFGLKKRIRAWRRVFGDVPADSFVLIPDAVQLADAGQLQALTKVARDFDVVVIDTLARTSAGLEENSAKDMGVYINNAYKIRDSAHEAGATVLIVHHTGYDTKRARGSSALFANGDGEVLIESDDPHELMTMTIKKRKDGEAGQQLYMHLETVDCGDWTSCVVEALTEVEAGEATPAPEPRRTRADDILDVLSDTEWMTQAAIREATGLGRSTVSTGCSALVQQGRAERRSGERSDSPEYRRMNR